MFILVNDSFILLFLAVVVSEIKNFKTQSIFPMSHTFSREVHQGEVKKKENAAAEVQRKAEEEERAEAARWVDGDQKMNKHQEKAQKEEERKMHKLKLKEMYEKEMEDAQ